MPAGLVEIADTRLFVDDRGEPGAPPLLFIHGGPGQGCYDFMHAQGDLLARSLRVIAVDQRGVLRSDPLPAEPPLTRELLVSDFEALRARLGIAAWAVLGHSAGGGYALRYVTSHPQAVQSVIFDCPGWDADLTERYRLPEIARRLEDLGQLADAADAGSGVIVARARLPTPDEQIDEEAAADADSSDNEEISAAPASGTGLVAAPPDDTH